MDKIAFNFSYILGIFFHLLYTKISGVFLKLSLKKTIDSGITAIFEVTRDNFKNTRKNYMYNKWENIPNI